MMISEGNGMQADSIAINAITPRYPVFEMTAMTMAASQEMIFSVIVRVRMRPHRGSIRLRFRKRECLLSRPCHPEPRAERVGEGSAPLLFFGPSRDAEQIPL